MRRTKTKALPSLGPPNNWQTLGETTLPSWKHALTRARRRLITITHALFTKQPPCGLNWLGSVFETTGIRGKCWFFFFTNSNARVYTPGPGASPPPSPSHLRRSLETPKTDIYLCQMLAKITPPWTKSSSALSSISGVRGQQTGASFEKHLQPNINITICVFTDYCAALSGHFIKLQIFTRNHSFPVARYFRERPNHQVSLYFTISVIVLTGLTGWTPLKGGRAGGGLRSQPAELHVHTAM